MPRCRAASPCSDPIRSGRASAGLGDDRGDAGTLGGRVAGTDDHTSDSARSVVGADPPGQLRRSGSGSRLGDERANRVDFGSVF
jgi:hypothetical protein